ncbi:MAG TPA: pantetheine-phosphate adenylyltransferase [Candidatus Faecivivens stercoravium]|uniref:Phosphopantetheine adenylyltransferase n=1 Tax=Candidatus Faecivivens stercoravium TaxID=2840803 RepID=A0A9D1DXI8_9FIRM|nr:pantetheine-phosphate adenylyltransferase [Candidatus Faecivivens stercoravium]
MKTAVCPGSFDPITMGHLDIISRASKLFGSVVVLVSVNAAKHSAFTLEERVELARKATAHLPNVRVDSFDGLLVDYLRGLGDCAIVKGLRAMSDFEYEFQMALANKKLYEGAETIFLAAGAEHMYLSSSLVKQIAHFGGDISGFVPDSILQEIQNRLSPKL